MKKLTDKQERFIKEYLKDLNATQAAIRAGYAEARAQQTGSDILKLPHIQIAIEQAQSKRNERLDVDADYVLNRLVEIDQMDALDILNDKLEIKPISEWPKVWRQSISATDVSTIVDSANDTETIMKKVKWPDKVRNLELLGKHVNVKAWDKEQSTTINVNISELDEAKKVLEKLGIDPDAI